MKNILISLGVAGAALAGLFLAVVAPAKKSAVRHIVIFKYKPEATEAQIQQVTEAFRELKHKISGILSFEQGVNNSPEEKNLGFTHVYLLTFEDAGARDTYLPHPEHRKFGRLLRELGILEDVFVVDYVPEA
jgi:hypothetical protein